MTALGDSSWLVRQRGSLQTLRFDDASALAIDFGRSAGILGQRRKGTSLYVALDEAYEDVVVSLTRDHATASGATPYLIDARWALRDLRRQECGFTVMAKGFGTGQMSWGGLKPGLYRLTARDSNEVVWEDEGEVGQDGTLAFTADADATSPVEIKAACLEGEDSD
jgi:polysaccharide biosynthesis protein PelA